MRQIGSYKAYLYDTGIEKPQSTSTYQRRKKRNQAMSDMPAENRHRPISCIGEDGARRPYGVKRPPTSTPNVLVFLHVKVSQNGWRPLRMLQSDSRVRRTVRSSLLARKLGVRPFLLIFRRIGLRAGQLEIAGDLDNRYSKSSNWYFE